MKTAIEVYFTNDGWAYPGVYQTLGNLPGLTYNEKTWTMLGALLLELLKTKEYNVIIYHNTRLVDEWTGEVDFLTPLAQKIATELFKGPAKSFSSLEIKKLDEHTVRREMERLKLV